jgi:hypothetical protein
MKLEKLSKSQESLMEVVKNEYINKFLTYKEIDFIKCKEWVDWLYKFSGHKEPLLIIVDSPMGAQVAANILVNLKISDKLISSAVRSAVRSAVDSAVSSAVYSAVYSAVRSAVRSAVDSAVRSAVRSAVYSAVRSAVDSAVYSAVSSAVRSAVDSAVDSAVYSAVSSAVSSAVRSAVDSAVSSAVYSAVYSADLKYFSFTSYGNGTDAGWMSFCDYFTKIGVVNNENFNKFKQFIDIGIYDMILLDSVCIVSRLPVQVNRRVLNLHGEDKPAIEFKDTYSLYFWNGVLVPEKLIMTPEAITKQDVLSVENAEVRRCYMEKLGAKKYYDILSDGKGLKKVHSDTDNQGNLMVLWETTINDDIINKKVQFLECVCPSTMRIYNLYPPNQQSKTAWEAKASTFNNEPGKFRQGDVMLLKIGEKHLQPVFET